MTERKWLEYVNPKEIDLFPLQFANCDRLKRFPALFIFDEVGSGKTITSGLMALDFIEESEVNRDVLVITTKALADGGENGQFLNEWFTKLPFKDMQFQNHVHIINNHHVHIEKNIDKKYGLVIIDEAHLFLNENTKKHIALTALNAEKVVFLTATPIKSNENDLQTYVEIAKHITGKEISNEWIEEIKTIGKEKHQLACSDFNLSLPVTRYFKDTIQSLSIGKEDEKKVLKRHETLVHQVEIAYDVPYKDYNKIKAQKTIEFIEERLQNEPDSRFVIFTRFIEKEALILNEALQNANYAVFKSNDVTKSYAVVTGENNSELSRYSNKYKNENLPTVLVVSYQIAEQGVNLPGYNHVINFHIPAFPSALEQRYGRIDRLAKGDAPQYESIYNCFILSNSYYDSNRSNFYTAIYIALNNLLKYLPSRNILLSKVLLNRYVDEASIQRRQLELFQEALKDKQLLSHLYETLKNEKEIDQTNNKLLLLFALYEKIEDFDFNDEDIENAVDFENALKKALDETIDTLSVKGTKLAESLLDTMNVANDTQIWDNIFYRFSNSVEENLQDLHAIKEAACFIKENDNYKLYKIKFEEELAPNYRFNQYKEVLDAFFYKMFNVNKFNALFPNCVNKSYEVIIQDYSADFSDIAKSLKVTLNRNDIDLILKNINRWASKLPIFVFFNEFGRRLGLLSIPDDKSSKYLCSRIRYDYNPFSSALYILMNMKLPIYPKIQSELQAYTNQELLDLLVLQKREEGEKTFIESSKYFKLLYHFSRKEICSFGYKDINGNQEYKYFSIFKKLENIRTEMVNMIYSVNVPNAVKEYFAQNLYHEIPINMLKELDAIEVKVLLEQYNGIVKKYNQLLSEEKDMKNYMSMFMHFVFSENPRQSTGTRWYRSWVEESYMYKTGLPKNYWYYLNDYWTINIIFELFNQKLDSKFIIDTSIPKVYTETLR